MADNTVTQNRHGQWCTRDIYGGHTPHPSREAAERVANSPYRS